MELLRRPCATPLCLQAIPILNDALAALDTIKEADIAYIKKLTNPPAAIKLVMEAVCVVLDVKPAKVARWGQGRAVAPKLGGQGGIMCMHGMCAMYCSH